MIIIAQIHYHNNTNEARIAAPGFSEPFAINSLGSWFISALAPESF